MPLPRTAVLAVGAVLAALVAVAALGGGREDVAPPPLLTDTTATVPDTDPLGFDRDRAEEFERRAILAHSHVIFVRTPGGVEAAAERTDRFRGTIERVAREVGVGPDTLEAMVYLESAGRPEVMASDSIEGAVGLAQILAETGQNLLDMRVDTEESARLGRRIVRERARGRDEVVERLRERRRRVDERFDPEKSLEAAGRYLTFAMDRLGREDLAVVSYHMGVGNLEGVIRAYTGEREGPIREVVEDRELSWTEVFFSTRPDEHPEAWERLSELADESPTYLWRVLASREVMSTWREDAEELRRREALFTAKASAEDAFHPEEETEVFDGPDDIEEARRQGRLVPLPDDPERLGFEIDPDMGELAAELNAEPETYRALRPEALATLVYIAREVRELSGAQAPLRLTSTVRDRDYQGRLVRENVQATRAYSLHTTGFAFDIARDYSGRRQARAFQDVLDRLRSLAVIAWAREPGAIHITASPFAEELVPLLGGD